MSTIYKIQLEKALTDMAQATSIERENSYLKAVQMGLALNVNKNNITCNFTLLVYFI